MKLILENWRQYVAESEKAQDYGYLYLSEEGVVRKTSFYDALNLLSENENAIETFLENWERSVDYHIEQLDEAALADMANNPILYLSTQAFTLIDRLKGKAIKHAGKILGVVNKVRSLLSRFEEKHPTLYKIGSAATKVIVAMLVIYAMSHIFGGGEAHAGDMLGGPELDQKTGEIAQKVLAAESQLKEIGQAASQVEGLEEVGQEILAIANNPTDVTGGIGGDVSWKAQKVIEHGLARMAKNAADSSVVQAATDAASGAADAAATIQATVSDPEVAKAADAAAQVARDAGLNETPT